MSGLDVEIVVERRTARGEPFRLAAELATGSGITVVCGPSGAGKTTLLLALVGAVRPGAGRIALDERVLFDARAGIDRPTRERRIGMVFQDAPLFPHRDAAGNVAFGMKGGDRARRLHELLERTGGSHLARRWPQELSGGERQRVALARALAAEPAALLLDEPFSAIDAPARAALADLLVELQRSAAIPFVHVTHDLGEALRVGTTLVLLDGGAVAQVGPPAQVIARPATVAAARAVGTENLFSAVVLEDRADRGCCVVRFDDTVVETGPLGLPAGARVLLGLRAEDILLALQPLHDTSARNVLAGRIEALVPGPGGVEVRIAAPAPIRAMVTAASVRELGLEPGRPIWLLIKATAFQRLDFDARTGR